MNLVEIKDFGFSYPESSRKVLEHVNLNIKEGTLNVIMGRSGCGKSTLLRQLKSVLAPAGEKEGEILYRNIPLRDTDHRTQSQEIGFVMQNPDNQIVATIVEEDVAFAPENLGVPPEEIRTRIDEAMKLAGIYEKREAAPYKLSGGQKQRVAIVRALCMHPEILLFDEVTAALDPEMVREVLDVMLDLAKQGKTMIIVTHEMQFARAIANRVIFLDGGKIVEEAAPAEFFDRPKTERAQRFLRTFTFDAVK